MLWLFLWVHLGHSALSFWGLWFSISRDSNYYLCLSLFALFNRSSTLRVCWEASCVWRMAGNRGLAVGPGCPLSQEFQFFWVTRTIKKMTVNFLLCQIMYSNPVQIIIFIHYYFIKMNIFGVKLEWNIIIIFKKGHFLNLSLSQLYHNVTDKLNNKTIEVCNVMTWHTHIWWKYSPHQAS